MTTAGFNSGPDGRYVMEKDTPERLELRRIFRERGKSYDFWIDNGMALVGSPDTVARQLEDQQRRLGYDVFCADFHFGPLPNDQVGRSMVLFAQEVMPAFN